MTAISLGLSGLAPALSEIVPHLVLLNLTDGQARPGDTLQAVLSNGMPITAYAWGSRPGGSDFGTGARLVVPEAAAGSLLYVSVQAPAGSFAATVPVMPLETAATVILPGPGRIEVETLAALQAPPGLAVSAGPSLIIVENA